jgi:hypothetical protein
MTTRELALRYPLLSIARSTRWTLSLTAVSARPTRITAGSPVAATSTSASTGMASIPLKANVFNFARAIGDVSRQGNSDWFSIAPS